MIFEILPWSIDEVEDFEDLKQRVLNKMRPKINRVDDSYKFLLELMKFCYTNDPIYRPSFKDILGLLKKNEMFLSEGIDMSQVKSYFQVNKKFILDEKYKQNLEIEMKDINL
jgi:hypothetical protein